MPRSLIWIISSVLLACRSPVLADKHRGAAGDLIRQQLGSLKGYLPAKHTLDSRAFLLAAPEPDSPRQVMDDAIDIEMMALRGTPRWELAIQDAQLSFPAAASTFVCSLGVQITKQETPALYTLLRRTVPDLGLATFPAKKYYHRKRPFMVNHKPICTPAQASALRGDGSYPSAHSAIGWGWALILSELAPQRSEAVLARGRAFGESRNVCNVHWRSDVVAGRLVGAAAFARLQSTADFLDAMDAARVEVVNQQAKQTPLPERCAREAAILAGP